MISKRIRTHPQRGRGIIYLADLVHNYAAKGPHTFPINIGYIASYAKKFYGDRIEVRLFKFPGDLLEAIKLKPPHIVGLSNYTWNLDINNRISRWVKSLSQDILTVYGGPDYPALQRDSARYLQERPFLDFYVINQGEKGFLNLLERYFQSSCIEEMKRSPVQNCSFYNKSANKVVESEGYAYEEDLGQIPSPYLSGILDEFFKLNLIPIIETNRGCPYSCLYCAWGKASQNRLFLFEFKRVEQEVEYIAKKTEKTNIFYIADANFGMLERDIKIAEFIREVRDLYGYPRHVSISWAKGTPQRVIKIAETLSDMISVTTSLQTMNPVVVKNIKRENIEINQFKQIQDYFNKKGISTYSELILGLPGETKESHLKALRELFACNTSGIACYNLRMLEGSELNTSENREKFGIRTKHRLVDGGFGKYAEIISIESEEMALYTETMTEEDILYFRPIHFFIQFLWNYKYYLEPLYFLKEKQINPVDFIITLIEKKDAAPVSVRKIFEDFIEEMHNEWFDTKEALFDHYAKPENFERLRRGEFGKLNYKYTYRFLLECRRDFEDYLFGVAEDMLKEQGEPDDIKEQLNDLKRYTSSVLVDFTNGLSGIKTSKTLELRYDILKWKEDRYKHPLCEYISNGIRLRFTLPDVQILTLKKLLKQFEGVDMNQTLRKMVELMNKSDLFYRADYLSQEGKLYERYISA